jgi:hypothetical protein
MSQTYKQCSEGSEAQNRAVETHDARNGGLEALNGSLKDLQTSSSRGYHQYDEEQDPDPDLDPQKSQIRKKGMLIRNPAYTQRWADV